MAFKKIIIDHNIELPEKTNTPKKPIRQLMQFFSTVFDERSQGCLNYPLNEILMIAFVAILGGATGFTDIADYGKVHEEIFVKYFMIKNGIPSHDTFRTVLSIIDPVYLQKATVLYLMENIRLMKRVFKIDDDGMKQYCVDGKTGRGTSRLKGLPQEVKAIHTLHVYDRSDDICIVSEPVGEKSNEIPTAQEILHALDLRGSIVTFDALNTQRDTIAAIIDQKGLYVASLKKNQQDLYQEIESFFTPDVLKQIETNGVNYLMFREKLHNRIETRKFYLSKNVSWLVQLNDWKGLKSLICYSLHTEDINSGKITDTLCYYIAASTDIAICADAIRGHWSVEIFHWNLDVNFFEDDIEIINRVAFQNISLLNKIALSFTKLVAPFLKLSVRSTRKHLGWNINLILKFFCILNEDILADAMLNVKV